MLPCTVTLADPVPGWFDLLATLTDPKSAVIACDTLPDRSATVTVVRRDPITDIPTRPRNELSDSHS
eukprot:2304192-Rhodomonas_salina.1